MKQHNGRIGNLPANINLMNPVPNKDAKSVVRLLRTNGKVSGYELSDGTRLTEYPEDVKVGFDIDENDVKPAEDDASQGDWLVLLRGMRVKGGVWEPLECVQKSVVVTDLGSQDFFKQTTHCIEKLLPKIRFEALFTFINLWKNKFIESIDGNRDTAVLTVPFSVSHHA